MQSSKTLPPSQNVRRGVWRRPSSVTPLTWETSLPITTYRLRRPQPAWKRRRLRCLAKGEACHSMSGKSCRHRRKRTKRIRGGRQEYFDLLESLEPPIPPWEGRRSQSVELVIWIGARWHTSKIPTPTFQERRLMRET